MESMNDDRPLPGNDESEGAEHPGAADRGAPDAGHEAGPEAGHEAGPEAADTEETRAFARPDFTGPADDQPTAEQAAYAPQARPGDRPQDGSPAAWGEDGYLFGDSTYETPYGTAYDSTYSTTYAVGASSDGDVAAQREAKRQARRERQARRRRVGAIGVAALALGVMGGVGGAAAYDYYGPEDAAVSTSNQGVTTQVVDSGVVASAPGSVQAVADQVLPSVVQVLVSSGNAQGSGSGIILTEDGTILTNAHVVEGAGDSSESDLVVSFSDGTTAPAEVVGEDPITDVAVIKAEGVSGLQPATLGRSSNLQVGQNVVAIGSPFGLSATVTTGIVSALDRPVAVGQIGETDQNTIYPAIQTDAAINPGNSGGPLVNLNGEVVGINSSIRTGGATLGGTSGSIGLGFAIPLDEVAPIITQIRNGEEPTHARIGITVSDAVSDAGLPRGAEVQSVLPDSAGARAGLRKGDIITRLDGTLVEGSDSLVAQIRSLRPGERITLEVLRDGETSEVQATLQSDADPA